MNLADKKPVQHLLLLVLLLLLSATSAQAQFQYPTPEELAKLKPRILLVVLRDEASEGDKYAADYNEAIRELAPKYLNFTSSIQYNTTQEAEALAAASPDKYAQLVPKEMSEMRSNRRVKYYAINLYLGKSERTAPIMSLGYATDMMSRSDLRFLLLNASTMLADISAGKGTEMGGAEARIARVKELTLLMPNEGFGMSHEEIQEAYTAPIKFVEDQEIFDAIDQQKPGVLYVVPIFATHKKSMMMALIEAETGRVLSMCGTGGISFAIGFREPRRGPLDMRSRQDRTLAPPILLYDSTNRPKLTKTILKGFLQVFAQKMNY